MAQAVVERHPIPEPYDTVSTHCRPGTGGSTWSHQRWAARPVIRRPPQLGQNPCPLQEKGTRSSRGTTFAVTDTAQNIGPR
jgi:hypothetical protein